MKNISRLQITLLLTIGIFIGFWLDGEENDEAWLWWESDNEVRVIQNTKAQFILSSSSTIEMVSVEGAYSTNN